MNRLRIRAAPVGRSTWYRLYSAGPEPGDERFEAQKTPLAALWQPLSILCSVAAWKTEKRGRAGNRALPVTAFGRSLALRLEPARCLAVVGQVGISSETFLATGHPERQDHSLQASLWSQGTRGRNDHL